MLILYQMNKLSDLVQERHEEEDIAIIHSVLAVDSEWEATKKIVRGLPQDFISVVKNILKTDPLKVKKFRFKTGFQITVNIVGHKHDIQLVIDETNESGFNNAYYVAFKKGDAFMRKLI